MSKAHKGKPPTITSFKKGHQGYWREKQGPWMGKHRTEETKKKLSEALKGKHHSKETKKKMSETQKRIGNRPPSWIDNPHKEETRGKLHTARLHQVFPQKDTKIEVFLQTVLNKAGVEFKTHYPILGQPDIFIEPNICVFVDGCMVHRCPKCYPTPIPEEKLVGHPFLASIVKNLVYDKKITEELQEQGYIVLRFWKHELIFDKRSGKKPLPEEEVVRRVLEQIKPVITPAS
jgi:DNA mismatch endonuclease (patch repair protein)